MAVLRITHIGICVADLERSERFYREGLGFERLSALEIAGEIPSKLLDLKDVDLEAIYLERDGMRIELLHYRSPGAEGPAEPSAMNQRGLTHLSVRVDDLAGMRERVAALGGRVLAETDVFNPDFQAGAVMAIDPDGTRIELIQSPGDPATPPGS